MADIEVPIIMTGTIKVPDSFLSQFLPPTATAPVSTAPVTTAPVEAVPVQVPPVSTPLELPALMMTKDWALNQLATALPLETRSLKSSTGDNQFTPKPIAETFYTTFGNNGVKLDCTMPVNIVNSLATPAIVVPVAITTDWGSDDEGPGVPCEGGSIEGPNDPNGDHHLLTFDTATGILHELFGTVVTAGKYAAQAYRRWNTALAQVGKPGQNSADAAGLPILPLLLRYAEAASGVIPHALRFTINLSRANGNGGAFCLPACHASGQNWSSTAYMGMRLRLPASYTPYVDAAHLQSTMSADAWKALTTILIALRDYGMVLADNGTSGLITSDDDPMWDKEGVWDAFNALGIKISNFEVLNSGAIIDSTGNPVQ